MHHHPIQPSYNPIPPIPYQSHFQNPNQSYSYPDPSYYYGQPYDPVQHPPPPSIDPHGSSSYYQNPVAEPESWVMKQAEPVRYSCDAQYSEKNAPVSLNSTWDNSRMTQPLGNSASNVTRNQVNAIQPMGCDVCNITCNSRDSYEKHVHGKKHKSKLYVQQSNPPSGSMVGTLNVMSNHKIPGTSGVTTAAGLEMKTRKVLDGGASVESVRVCTVCNIVCNSQDVLNNHLSGKKHALQAFTRLASGEQQFAAADLNPAPCISTLQPLKEALKNTVPEKAKVLQLVRCDVCQIECNNHNNYSKHLLGKKHQKNMEKLEQSKQVNDPDVAAAKPITESAPTKAKVLQSVWCDVCKLQCNTSDVFSKHLLGKKHLKNMEKLEQLKQVDYPAAAATNPMIGTSENPAASMSNTGDTASKRKAKKHSLEDLETKKRKIMEEGATADAVRACTMCNVVCNSAAVFNSHVSGHRHLAMLKQAVPGA